MQPPLSFTRSRASAGLVKSALTSIRTFQRRQYFIHRSLVVGALLDRLRPGSVGLSERQHGQDRRMTPVGILIGHVSGR